MSKRIYLTGKKYGKLTVIKPTKLILNRIRGSQKEYLQEYECLCDCGNTKLTTCSQLKGVLRGKGTSSCGCNQRKSSDGDEWSVSFNMLWKNYICHAAVYDRVFKLTKNQFNVLISDNCSYCGSPPHSIIKSKSKRRPNQIIYNGIDRVDNDRGYTIRNCVTCCETCNRMKLELSRQTFLDHVAKIVSYQHSIMG
jgi:hypothetical protein